VQAEVRAVPLRGLVLALHVRVGLGLETTGALLGCEPRCARFLFLALSSLCNCAWA
jgi:hypothetical protein